jgi:tetratricopeptide (TPR) repeat protein
LRDAVAIFQQSAGPLNASQHRRLLPVAYFELAKVLRALGRPHAAKDTCRDAIALFEQYVNNFPAISEYWVKLFDCYANLLPLLEQAGEVEEASRVCHQALRLYERLAGQLAQESADEAIPRIAAGLGAVLKTRGRPQDQEPAYRRALETVASLAARAPTSFGYRFHEAYWHDALAGLLTATGRAPEAARAYRRAADCYGAALKTNPDHVPSLNNLAWLLATCPDPQVRDTSKAVRLAKQATALLPHARYVWITLGAAYYRAGDWHAAVAALDKSLALDADGFKGEQRPGHSHSFLALAHWHLGHKEEARKWYDAAVTWMEKNAPHSQELRRFRAEASELLGIERRDNKSPGKNASE